MVIDDQVTLGELYRLNQAQSRVLDEIRADVRAQNGRVIALEKDAIRIKTIWSLGVAVGVIAWEVIKAKVWKG